MRTVIFIPPLPRMSGGLAVLYQVADRLQESGRECALVSPNNDAPGLEERGRAGFPILSWPDPGLRRGDCFLAPEGWPNALAPALSAGARCLVYVQNWAFLLSALPQGVRWQKLPVSFLAVSRPVAWFVEETAGLPLAGTVRPMLDPALYAPGEKEEGALRVAWMPRKNKALGEQVKQIAEASLARRGFPLPPRWAELHRLAPAEVAEALGKSHIFLSTGFPEGFGLPPLEAMACGCLPVGFTGFGGWDYMREAGEGSGPPSYFPAPALPWGGNGFYAADGDAIGAARALEEAAFCVAGRSPRLAEILGAGRAAALAYSRENQAREVHAVWSALEAAPGAGTP